MLCWRGGGGGASEGGAPQFPTNPSSGGSSGRSRCIGVLQFVLIRSVHSQWAPAVPGGGSITRIHCIAPRRHNDTGTDMASLPHLKMLFLNLELGNWYEMYLGSYEQLQVY